MIPLAKVWFVLPVTRGSQERFYAKTRELSSRAVRAIQANWGAAASSPEAKAAMTRAADSAFRGPWPYSDVIGFVILGQDHGDSIAGNVLLKRKHFPRGSEERVSHRGQTERLQEMMWYAELGRTRVRAWENAAYVKALRAMIREAQAFLRRRLRGAAVHPPGVDLDYIDFVRLYPDGATGT